MIDESTANFPHLKHAPVVEAIIDIRADLESDDKRSLLDVFRESIKSEYPATRVREEVSASLELSDPTIDAPGIAKGARQFDGYLLTSKSGIQVAQGRVNGFSFSRLSPYESWENLAGC